MNKDQAVSQLLNLGFNAVLESGVIIITVADEKTAKKAEKAIKEIGYDASWGWRIERKVAEC